VRNRVFIAVCLLLALLMVMFLALPLVGLFWHVGLLNLLRAFLDPEVLRSILLTLGIALAGVMLAGVTGIPLAYLLARYNFRGKSVIEAVIDIPVMVPHTAAGIALLLAFTRPGIRAALESMGLSFMDSPLGIMAAMSFLSAPLLINGAKEGFRKIDVRYEKAARTLGASRAAAFVSVALPLARKDIVNGGLMMWSRGLGEFGAVVVIAYHPMVAPVLIYDRFNSFGLRYSAPVAAAMIAISILIFLLVRLLNNRGKS
jgi:molybdate/tungstate transport system permease protein